MIAAVAAFSFAYFAVIELMAFSYAISGCSFSMSEIQSETKPFQRLARRPNMDIDVSLCRRFVQLRRFLHDFCHCILSEEFEDRLDVELLRIALLHDLLLFFHALQYDGTQIGDLLLQLRDALLRIVAHRFGVARAGADVALQRLDLLHARFDDLIDRYAEGAQRRFDDLLAHDRIGSGLKALQKIGRFADPAALFLVDARGFEYRIEIDVAARSGGRRRVEDLRHRLRRFSSSGCRVLFRRLGKRDVFVLAGFRGIVLDDEPPHDGGAPTLLFGHEKIIT